MFLYQVHRPRCPKPEDRTKPFAIHCPKREIRQHVVARESASLKVEILGAYHMVYYPRNCQVHSLGYRQKGGCWEGETG